MRTNPITSPKEYGIYRRSRDNSIIVAILASLSIFCLGLNTLHNIRKHLRNWFGRFATPRNGVMSTERSTFVWHEIETRASSFAKNTHCNQFVHTTPSAVKRAGLRIERRTSELTGRQSIDAMCAILARGQRSSLGSRPKGLVPARPEDAKQITQTCGVIYWRRQRSLGYANAWVCT